MVDDSSEARRAADEAIIDLVRQVASRAARRDHEAEVDQLWKDAKAGPPRGGSAVEQDLTMADQRLVRSADLRHHFDEGTKWLNASDQGENTIALAYAAFEYRLAVERIALHHWRDILGRSPTRQEVEKLRSFKAVEQQIYDMAGNQKEINLHFDFMGVVFDLMEIAAPPVPPNFGKLANAWHECSELCHVTWTFTSSVAEARSVALAKLENIRDLLSPQVEFKFGWLNISDPAFMALRDKFVAGTADRGDIEAYLKKTGLWAKRVYNDGRPSDFVGKAVPPEEGSQ